MAFHDISTHTIVGIVLDLSVVRLLDQMLFLNTGTGFFESKTWQQLISINLLIFLSPPTNTAHLATEHTI